MPCFGFKLLVDKSIGQIGNPNKKNFLFGLSTQNLQNLGNSDRNHGNSSIFLFGFP
jgi:hypothetical protein